MTDYPNDEHRKADEAARRRALKAVTELEEELTNLEARLQRGSEFHVGADDVQGLSDNLRKLTGHLGELGALYDVRQWHAADQYDMRYTPAAGDVFILPRAPQQWNRERPYRVLTIVDITVVYRSWLPVDRERTDFKKYETELAELQRMGMRPASDREKGGS